MKMQFLNRTSTIMVGLMIIFGAFTACKPSLKLNRGNGLVQINQSVDLKARPKNFKKKHGPVEIRWFVNGSEMAQGDAYTFVPSETGNFQVKAEAMQHAKSAEAQIRLESILHSPELINLVNGIEKFSEKPAATLSMIHSRIDTLPVEEKRDGEKLIKTVWAEEEKTYSASKNPDEFVMYDPNANVLWPGALIQGKSIASGVPDIIPISPNHRLPGKVTLSILSGATTRSQGQFFKETEMTKSAVTQAMNEILGGYGGGTPAQYSYSKEIIHSASQVQFALNMGYAGPAAKVDGKLNVDWSSKKSRMVVKLYQKFFTMTYDDPQGVEGVFRPSIELSDIKPYAGAGNPVCYISSVTYGRTYVLLYESELSTNDLEAAINFAYDGVVAKGYADSKLKSSLENGSITVKAFQVGGDPRKGLDAALNQLDPEKLATFITEGANFSPQNPGEIISYTINYLKDASLVRMNSAMEYTVSQKTPISSEEFVLIPSVINQNKDAAESMLKSKGLQMRITASQQDCSKNANIVSNQGLQAGGFAKAGSSIPVTVIAERSVTGSPVIAGSGELHVIGANESYSQDAWALANTGVQFGVSGDECTTAKIGVTHPLWGYQSYSLNAGEKKDITTFFGPGTIKITLASSDPNAKLHLRVW